MIRTSLQIRFADVDSANHVHNSVYLHYFELGRIDFFVSLVASKGWDWTNHGLILARNEIDYLAPLLLGDKPYVQTDLEGFGEKSITLAYQVCQGEGENKIVYAKGKSIVVCYDHSEKGTMPIPDQWKQALTKISHT